MGLWGCWLWHAFLGEHFRSGLAFSLWVGIFLLFLGVAGVQTPDMAAGDGDDAVVSCTWLSPTSCFGPSCPLQQREASPWSILARSKVARGAPSGAHHQRLSPGWESASSQLCGARHGHISFPSISWGPGGRNAFFHHSEDQTVLTRPLDPCPITQKRVLSPTPRGWRRQRTPRGQGWISTTSPPTAGEHPSALPRPFQLHVLA